MLTFNVDESYAEHIIAARAAVRIHTRKLHEVLQMKRDEAAAPSKERAKLKRQHERVSTQHVSTSNTAIIHPPPGKPARDVQNDIIIASISPKKKSTLFVHEVNTAVSDRTYY